MKKARCRRLRRASDTGPGFPSPCMGLKEGVRTRMTNNALCSLYHKHYITHKGRDPEGLGLFGSSGAPQEESDPVDFGPETGYSKYILYTTYAQPSGLP